MAFSGPYMAFGMAVGAEAGSLSSFTENVIDLDSIIFTEFCLIAKRFSNISKKRILVHQHNSPAVTKIFWNCIAPGRVNFLSCRPKAMDDQRRLKPAGGMSWLIRNNPIPRNAG
jgi:hypothetical protein